MSVTTSQQFNPDRFMALLPQGATVRWTGADWQDAAAKTLEGVGFDDAALGGFISQAAADYPAYAAAQQTIATNKATLTTKAAAALTTNTTYLAIASPTAAQVAAQVKALTMESSAIIRLLTGMLNSTAGT